MKFKILSIIITVIMVISHMKAYAMDISAQSAVVVDCVTGEIIYEKNAFQKRSMASTTKIMTAICALENGNLSDMVKVHPSAVGVEGSSMYLGNNEIISLKDLLYGLMLASGNDAAVAIAMHISGSIDAFAQLMNQTAIKIGVKDTAFKNPNGLDDEGHYTTAYDLAQITRYGMSIPEFAEIVATDNIKVTWQGRDYPRVLKNHNKLLRMYNGCDGVKTGFTKKSGRCLVSSATGENYRVIAVTLNAPNDWQDHQKMLDYAFENYECREIIKKDSYVATLYVKNGVTDNAEIISGDSFFMPVKNGALPQAEIEYVLPENLQAPIEFGSKIGKIQILYNGIKIGEIDAVSNSSIAYVEPKSFLKSLYKIFKIHLRSFI